VKLISLLIKIKKLMVIGRIYVNFVFFILFYIFLRYFINVLLIYDNSVVVFESESVFNIVYQQSSPES